MRDIFGGRLAHAFSFDESPATHEVSALATRALEHHIERRSRPWPCSNALSDAALIGPVHAPGGGGGGG